MRSKTDRIEDLPVLKEMVAGLRDALGPRLGSVVLYGSAARGDWQASSSDLNLLIVLHDLEPATLERLRGPFRRWSFHGQPVPHLFSPQTLVASADTFPGEMLDIVEHHRVLHGPDPLGGIQVSPEPLRLQCERELREKLMRLAEGYVESHARPRELERLLAASYTTFLAIFRSCLRLGGGVAPARNEEVFEAFCRVAGLDPAPFREIEELRRGGRPPDAKELFTRYHAQLGRAVDAVDRWVPKARGEEERS